MLDIATDELVSSTVVVAVTNGTAVPVYLDIHFAASWQTPKNQRECERSPQRTLWRAAMELKMDQYKALNMFKLVKVNDLPTGTKVMRTLWAFKISLDAVGVFKS